MDSQLKFKRKVYSVDFSIEPPTTREGAIKMFSEIVNGFPEDYEFNMIIVGSAQSQLIPIDGNASE